MGPALVTFCLDVDIGLAAGEEEVVEDEIVKVLGCVFGYFLYLLPMFGVGIGEGLEAVRLVDRVGDTASDFYASVLEELLCLFQCFVRNNQQVAVCFQINLVYFYLAGDNGPGRIQPMQVFHFFYFVSPRIDGYFKALVIAGMPH